MTLLNRILEFGFAVVCKARLKKLAKTMTSIYISIPLHLVPCDVDQVKITTDSVNAANIQRMPLGVAPQASAL